MARIVVGVTGGIAAYKSATLIRLLTEANHQVRVVPTNNALKFIGEVTLEALSHSQIETIDSDMYSDSNQVKHLEIARWAEIVVVAPATANFLAKIAHGIADDLLSTTVLSASCPVVLAPAMHTEMWENPATVENIRILSERNIRICGPSVGRLTGEDTGVGRMLEPADIYIATESLLGPKPLAGKNVLVTAGGTREPIDDARFIGNFSSGKQGLAFARQAELMGAAVTLIACNLEIDSPGNMKIHHVTTAKELADSLENHLSGTDLLVMAAAVADFSPEAIQPGKIHRSSDDKPLSLSLKPNPDLLKNLASRYSGRSTRPIFVGFAAESGEKQLKSAANSKRESKGIDFIIGNDISGDRVFGKDSNQVILLGQGLSEEFAGSKAEVARLCLSALAAKLGWK